MNLFSYSRSVGVALACGLIALISLSSCTKKKSENARTITTEFTLSNTSPSLGIGESLQLQAIENQAAGRKIDLTDRCDWSITEGGNVASVSAKGLLKGLSGGSFIVNVIYEGISQNFSGTVTENEIESLTFNPSSLTLSASDRYTLSVKAEYQDGTTEDVTADAEWSSNNKSKVRASSGGNIEAIATGSASITAKYEGVSASITVTVSSASLLLVNIVPDQSPDLLYSKKTYRAYGVYSDGSLRDITSSVNWSSDNTSVVSAPISGKAEIIGAGTAVITATKSGKTGTWTTVPLSNTLSSLAVDSASGTTLPIGSFTLSLSSIGSYSGGVEGDLSGTSDWSVTGGTANASYINIDDDGVLSLTDPAQFSAGQTIQVTASKGGQSDVITINLSSETLDRIVVHPSYSTLSVGSSLPLVAYGEFSGGTNLDLTSQASWSSANSSKVIVSNTATEAAPKGFVKALEYSATPIAITASKASVSGQTSIAFNASPLQSIAISPSSLVLKNGEVATVKITGTYLDTSTADVTSGATWSGSSSAVSTALISNPLGSNISISANAVGSTSITFSYGGKSISLSVTVTSTDPVLSSITISPSTSQNVAQGSTLQFSAVGTYSDSSTRDLTANVLWTSSNTSTAGTISNSAPNQGRLTIKNDATVSHSTNISASYDSVNASAVTVTVLASELVAINLSPTSASIEIGGTTAITATGSYSDLTTANISGSASWASSQTGIATVSGGTVTGVAAGTSSISASFSGVDSNQATVTTIAIKSPVSFSATAISKTQIDLSWTDQSSVETGFEIERSTSSGSGFVNITTTAANATSYSNTTGLSASTTYYYRIRTINASGNSSYSSVVSATTLAPAPPSAPTGVSATAGNSNIDISWNAVAGATSYNIYWATLTGVTTGSTQISGVTSTHNHSSLSNGTTYYYIVTAVNADGEGVASSEVSATPIAPPSIPTGVSASASNAATSISWSAVAGATSYNVYWATSTGVTTGSTKITGATSTYSHTSLSNGTTYYYVVTAVNAGGESSSSSEVSATPVAPPSPPTGVSASAGNASTSISWSASAGATSYNIYWATSSGVTTGSTKITGATSAHSHTSLINGTTYYYVVTAVNDGGESSISSEVSATPSAAPSAPSAFDAAAAAGAVDLTWTAPGVGTLGYLLVRKAGSTVDFTPTNGTKYYTSQSLGSSNYAVSVGRAKQAFDRGLDPSVTYHYALFAFNSSFNYSPASTDSVMPNSEEDFAGINLSILLDKDRKIRSYWDMPGECTTSPWSSLTYDIFVSASTGTQNFGSPDASTSACANYIDYDHADSPDTVYMVARSSADSNTIEEVLNTESGSIHRAIGHLIFHQFDPTKLRSSTMGGKVVEDPWGNYVMYYDNLGFFAICHENKAAPYCRGSTIGLVNSIQVEAGRGDGDSGVYRSKAYYGSVDDFDFDMHGNLFIVDSTYKKIRAYCFNPNTQGFCSGKTKNYYYNVWGTGTSSFPSDDVAATSNTLNGTIYLKLDNFGNIYVGDNGRYVHVACFDTGTYTGACAGRSTAGNVYRLIGTGVSGDAADNVVALGAQISAVYSLTIDHFGNVYFSDSASKIRSLCYNVEAPGSCNGKTIGNTYHVDDLTSSYAVALDIDVAGNILYRRSGASKIICLTDPGWGYCHSQTLSTTYTIESVAGEGSRIAFIDRYQNLIHTRIFSYYGFKAYCIDVASGGACLGKTSGVLNTNIYPMETVAATSYAFTDGTSAVDAYVGATEIFTTDPFGNLYVYDGASYSVNVICNNSASVGICNSKAKGSLHKAAGNGSLSGSATGVATTAVISTLNSMTSDQLGNIYWSVNYGSLGGVYLYCNDTSAGSCSGKTVGNVYRIIGGGSSNSDAEDPGAINLFSVGPTIAVDSDYNVYFTTTLASIPSVDYSVRVLCINNTASHGFCSGKTTSKVYIIVGDGTSGTGSDGDAISTSFRVASDYNLLVDSGFNVYFNGSSSRLFVACFDSAVGSCSLFSRSAGKVYRVIGNGSAGDAADQGSSTNPNTLASDKILSIDFNSLGDVVYTTKTDMRIRILCLQNASGFCSGKFIGNTP